MIDCIKLPILYSNRAKKASCFVKKDEKNGAKMKGKILKNFFKKLFKKGLTNDKL